MEKPEKWLPQELSSKPQKLFGSHLSTQNGFVFVSNALMVQQSQQNFLRICGITRPIQRTPLLLSNSEEWAILGWFPVFLGGADAMGIHQMSQKLDFCFEKLTFRRLDFQTHLTKAV